MAIVLPCESCGENLPTEMLDSKPSLLRRRTGWRGWLLRRLQRWLMTLAADEGVDFDRLECASCYGPGWLPAWEDL